jgi:hypothetical protein
MEVHTEHADFLIMSNPKRSQRLGGRHNYRLSRKATSWSSGRDRAGLMPSVRERLLRHTHVHMKIHLRRLHGFVPQPERDHSAINNMLKKALG